MASCDGCKKKAIIMEEENLEIDQEKIEGLDDENAFECCEQNKDAIHEVTESCIYIYMYISFISE